MSERTAGGKVVIGMISAVPMEGESFLKKLRPSKKGATEQPVVYSGRALDKTLIYAISGIGKTNAAHSAAVLIRNYLPTIIINFGIGGAYPSAGLKVGDIAIATKEVYADEGVCLKNGFHTLRKIGIPVLRTGRRKYFNEFPLDRNLCKSAFHITQGLCNSRRGTFLTVSTCTGTAERARELSVQFRAICENMEGAAIAHICRLYDIPCVEIRGISNMVDERDTSKWNVPLAVENCQKTVRAFLSELKARE